MVNEAILAPQPTFENIKEQFKEEWMADQITDLSERFIDQLLSRYEIVVEETEVPITEYRTNKRPCSKICGH